MSSINSIGSSAADLLAAIRQQLLAKTSTSSDAQKASASGGGLDAVIWTELPSNFKDHTGRDFSPEVAVKYLGELPKVLVDQAKEYVDRAPKEIETPLRAKLREEGWPV